MPVDPKYLREHYASLSDDALQAINRSELVAAAQQCYDDEVRRRKDARRIPGQTNLADENPEFDAEPDGGGDKPGWLSDAAEVFSRVDRPGAPPAADLADAQDALEAAGIPCYLDLSEIPADDSPRPPTHLWRVMVPGNLNLRAASVLDRDIFNQEYEDEWKTLLETLSDEELSEMKPEVVFCGLFDRVERVTKAYDEELARRKLK
jgi:hypothetical protein